MSDALTFQELRDKCYRHLKEKHYLYCGSRKFKEPDKTWLRDEFLEIRDSLKSNKVDYSHSDLVYAFCSVVYQMEYGTIIYPNSLVVIGGELCRVISFEFDYPVKMKYKVFSKNGYGQLKKSPYTLPLKASIQRVLLRDPLVKNDTARIV